MSLLKRLASDTAVYGISNIASRLINYIVMTPFLTRIFAPEEFGAVTDIYVYAAFLTVAFTYRMDTAFFRFGHEADKRDNAFATSWLTLLVTTLVFVTGLIGFSSQLAAAALYPNHAEYIVFLALIVGADALSAIPFAQLRLENKAKHFAGIKLLNVIINSALVVVLLALLPKLQSENSIIQWLCAAENKVACVFIANLVASLSSLLLLSPAIFKIPTIDKTNTTELRKEMLAYSMPLLIVSLAGMVNEVLDRTLLKMFLPGTPEQRLAQVGIYGACYKLPTLMSIFTTAFNYAAEPLFFSNAKRDDAKQLYADTAHIFCIAACVGCLGILLYIDVLQYILGKDFRSGLAIVPILLLANLFFGLYNNFSIWYKLSDKTIYGTYIALVGALITLVVNIVFIPTFGFYASAYATLACYATICVATYALGQRFFEVPYPIAKMSLYIIIAVILFFLNQWLSSFLPNLVSKIGLSTLLMLIFLAVIYFLTKQKNIIKH